MKTSPLILIITLIFFLISCGDSKKPETTGSAPGASSAPSTDEYDPNRGIGKFNEETLVLESSLNATMADNGEKIAGVKCHSCHKLTDERLVGPGLKGVTERRAPYWIMNFITNPDPMIDKDPELQTQLEICLLRMPNQSLTEDDARNVLEYLRRNDGLK
ncbi:MAG: c-type cytochrome [Saprospiraceae bacterium]